MTEASADGVLIIGCAALLRNEKKKMTDKLVMIRDGLFDEEIYSDLNKALKEEDCEKLALRIRSFMEIVYMNIVVHASVLSELKKQNWSFNPEKDLKKIERLGLAKLIGAARSLGTIDKKEESIAINLKSRCNKLVHKNYSIVLTAKGLQKLHGEAVILFKVLLEKNAQLKAEWNKLHNEAIRQK